MGRQYKPLLNPATDALALGGLSILLVPLLALVSPDSKLVPALMMTSLVLSFTLSFPHIVVSYRLFYGENKSRVLGSLWWIVVGVVLPALLFIFLGVCYAITYLRDIGYIISLMVFLLGWHYSRQAIGTAVSVSEHSGYFLDRIQKGALQLNLLSLWLMSLLEKPRRPLEFEYHSMRYPYALLSEEYGWMIYSLLGISLALFFGRTLLRFRREKKSLPWVAWLPLVAVHLWFFPEFSNFAVLLFVPIFHGLQYLYLVFAYRWIDKPDSMAPNAMSKKLSWWWLVAFFVGALTLEILPRTLDLLISMPDIGLTIFLALFNVFFHLHHYFIDMLLWPRGAPMAQSRAAREIQA